MYDYLNTASIQVFIEGALLEDIGPGDYSTLSCVDPNAVGAARLLLKSDGILAGVQMAKHICAHFDPALIMEVTIKDGAEYTYGQQAFLLRGKARSILSVERLILNCMQRMSGIATYTHRLAAMIAHTNAKLLDTRKTTPNFRLAEKWAVRIGGGHNHRYGLFDMIMLKDNHIDFAGGVVAAVHAAHQYVAQQKLDLKIEVEVRNQEELTQVLSTGKVHRVLLDNMRPDQIVECVRIVQGRIETEASGGIDESTIIRYAETGVDFISLGSLTHSAKSLDMSLKAL